MVMYRNSFRIISFGGKMYSMPWHLNVASRPHYLHEVGFGLLRESGRVDNGNIKTPECIQS